MELLCQGPGMQCRHLGGPTDFFSGDALERKDADDAAFYAEPRLVNHLDDHAVSRITALHGRLLQPGIEVLDLMAAFTPYLPEGLELQRHAGLGLNREELERNPSLTEQVVHDLNPPGGGPRLPFDDASFHAVTCVASWEYLAHPLETAAEVARVLRPGGLCVVSFSNRWFPGKTVRIWPELHDFERMGYVLECLLRTGSFQDLETRSERGRPRPATDRHFPAFPESDPVFAVWGTRKD
jgi:SAM-dependent methyltransferase